MDLKFQITINVLFSRVRPKTERSVDRKCEVLATPVVRLTPNSFYQFQVFLYEFGFSNRSQ